mgnify:CR=1 FL=1
MSNPYIPDQLHHMSKKELLEFARTAHEENVKLVQQLAKANERVEELEKSIKNNELVHVGFTNGDQIKYANVEEGSFYPDTSGYCFIPLYMLKSHEHRIETTSIEQLRKEQDDV